jgi:hypothetical protein
MSKPKKQSDFKAVEFMREVREKLSEQYKEDPDGFKKDLAKATEDFMALRKQSGASDKRKRA